MGLDVGHSLNGAAGWLCTSRPINAIVSNPVFTALLITCIVVIVVLSLFRCVWRAGWRRVARLAVYLLLAVSAVVFVHHYAAVQRLRADDDRLGRRELFTSVLDKDASAVGGALPVAISVPTPLGGPDVEDAAPSSDAAPKGDAPRSATSARDITPSKSTEKGAAPCPCKGVPAALPLAAGQTAAAGRQAVGPRPDNVRLDNETTIADVVLTRPLTGIQA